MLLCQGEGLAHVAAGCGKGFLRIASVRRPISASPAPRANRVPLDAERVPRRTRRHPRLLQEFARRAGAISDWSARREPSSSRRLCPCAPSTAVESKFRPFSARCRPSGAWSRQSLRGRYRARWRCRLRARAANSGFEVTPTVTAPRCCANFERAENIGRGAAGRDSDNHVAPRNFCALQIARAVRAESSASSAACGSALRRPR